jgi:hypothetical protein
MNSQDVALADTACWAAWITAESKLSNRQYVVTGPFTTRLAEARVPGQAYSYGQSSLSSAKPQVFAGVQCHEIVPRGPDWGDGFARAPHLHPRCGPSVLNLSGPDYVKRSYQPTS